MTTTIRLQDVSKFYGELAAVDDVSFKVRRGEILALLGASGCGKTTTLRLIAGLERPDVGEVWLGGEMVAGNGTFLPPEKRAIGMVFQDYALFPHLTVADNVSFSLKRASKSEKYQRVADMLHLAGLGDLGGRFPHQLSGGQQQRVALARALAPNPTVVLLDEPFSNLDAALRREMRHDVQHILNAAGATAVFVTHDQEEALSIADKVAVLRAGRILQVGTPREVYLQPANRAVAAFVGETNFVPGEADGDNVATALGQLPLANSARGAVEVLLRPEWLTVESATDGNATVQAVEFLGHSQQVTLALDDGTHLTARADAMLLLSVGERVAVRVNGAVLAF